MDISGRKQHDVAAASIPAPVAATVAVVRAGSSSSCESDMSTPSHSASHGVGSQLAERRGLSPITQAVEDEHEDEEEEEEEGDEEDEGDEGGYTTDTQSEDGVEDGAVTALFDNHLLSIHGGTSTVRLFPQYEPT